MKYWFGRPTADDYRGCLAGFDRPLKARDFLCIGSINHINGRASCADDVVITVDLPVAIAQHPINTVLVAFDFDAIVNGRVYDLQTGRTRDFTLPFLNVCSQMRLGAELTACVLDFTPRAVDTVKSFVPLFLVQANSREGDRGAQLDDMHFYSQVRFRDCDALFVRTSTTSYVQAKVPEDIKGPCSMEAGHALSWFKKAVALHQDGHLFLNNHQCYYRKCFKGCEIEVKFTLPPQTDVWGLTVECYNRIVAGRLPGFMVEYRDDFQQWDYWNVLYDVTGPAGEEGYVSFIATTDGRHIVKRKWFSDDWLIRRESISPPQTIDNFDAYVRDVLEVVAESFAPFRRVRYDVNFESQVTGHVYGIFFDSCTIIDVPDLELVQCEVEYLRSRTLIEPREDLVLNELEQIVSWVRDLLVQSQVDFQEGYYSKLSFLRDARARRVVTAQR